MPSITDKKDDGVDFLCLGAVIFNMLFEELVWSKPEKPELFF